MRRRRHPRGRGEKGIALIETALTMPLFFLLIFGTMEFGLAFRNYITMSNAARDGARFASTLGQAIDSDFQVMAEMTRNLDGLDVTMIVIFKGAGPESTVESGALASCKSGSVNNLCNTYAGADLDVEPSDFGCGPTSPDAFWCPDARNVNLSDPPDYIGVYIEIDHHGLTGVLGMDRTFREEVVMRMEPLRA